MRNVITSGPKFTWNNKRKRVSNIKEKLDRFLANDHWRQLFPKAFALNCGYYRSDHKAVKLTLNHSKWVQKGPLKKSFVFENKWILKDSFCSKAKE